MQHAPVVVECDRCHRPVTRLVAEPGRVRMDGAARASREAPTLPGLRRDGVMAGDPRLLGRRRSRTPDRVVVPAYRDPAGEWDRWKLICFGRKHGRYERVVTQAALDASDARARSTGRDRIGMREIRR